MTEIEKQVMFRMAVKLVEYGIIEDVYKRQVMR